jgi:hypothetical protein
MAWQSKLGGQQLTKAERSCTKIRAVIRAAIRAEIYNEKITKKASTNLKIN